MIDYNSAKLIEIENKIIALGWYKYHPKKCFCTYVAEHLNEVGQDAPSDSAIRFAKHVLNVYKGLVKKVPNKPMMSDGK